MWSTVLVLVAIFVGSSMQRVSGMGFALVAAPFLILLLGPIDGVILVNLCGVITAAVILLRVATQVDWRRAGTLTAYALLGIVPGSIVLRYIPSEWLQISIGLLIVVGLTVSVSLGHASVQDRHIYRVLAGVTSGFMNATAGIGGPAVSIYALATNWPHRSFVATVQPYFLSIGVASIAAKFIFGSAAVPALPVTVWLLIAAACLAGLLLGEILAKRIKPLLARRLLITVAYVGSAGTIARGIVELLS